MTRILVTGGSGFIGSVLAEKLISNRDNYVVIVDDLSTGSEDKLPTHLPNDNWRFVKADVNEYRDIAERQASSLILRRSKYSTASWNSIAS